MMPQARTDQSWSRPAAVAGKFYPAEAASLRRVVEELLGCNPKAPSIEARNRSASPKAIIAPHAGYPFSGPVAGSAYRWLRQSRGLVKRVVLFGPDHRMRVCGIATSSASSFTTPLGKIRIDDTAACGLMKLPTVAVNDEAHASEHGLEVQLPFLCATLGSVDHPTDDFSIVPLLFGLSNGLQAAQVIDSLWGGPETLIVVSSDLSHYHDHATASQLDQETAIAIERGASEHVGPEQACGHVAIQALLHLARQRGLACQCVDLRNSGDTAGPKDQVVGYGAFIFT